MICHAVGSKLRRQQQQNQPLVPLGSPLSSNLLTSVSDLIQNYFSDPLLNYLDRHWILLENSQRK